MSLISYSRSVDWAIFYLKLSSTSNTFDLFISSTGPSPISGQQITGKDILCLKFTMVKSNQTLQWFILAFDKETAFTMAPQSTVGLNSLWWLLLFRCSGTSPTNQKQNSGVKGEEVLGVVVFPESKCHRISGPFRSCGSTSTGEAAASCCCHGAAL